MVILGLNDISRLHSEYLDIRSKTNGRYAENKATIIQKEVCIEEIAELLSDDKLDKCLSSAFASIVATKNAINKQLEIEKKQAFKKIILFYFVFVVFFLIVPPLFLYVFLVFLVYFVFNLKTGNDS